MDNTHYVFHHSFLSVNWPSTANILFRFCVSKHGLRGKNLKKSVCHQFRHYLRLFRTVTAQWSTVPKSNQTKVPIRDVDLSMTVWPLRIATHSHDSVYCAYTGSAHKDCVLLKVCCLLTCFQMVPYGCVTLQMEPNGSVTQIVYKWNQMGL